MPAPTNTFFANLITPLLADPWRSSAYSVFDCAVLCARYLVLGPSVVLGPWSAARCKRTKDLGLGTDHVRSTKYQERVPHTIEKRPGPPPSANDDGADHAGMNGAVVVKRPGGRECDRELTARRHDSRIPDAGIRRRCVSDAIGVRPRHR